VFPVIITGTLPVTICIKGEDVVEGKLLLSPLYEADT
jgi:hypothetical protein